MKDELYLHKQFPWKTFRNYFQTQINTIRPIVLIWRKAMVTRDKQYAEKSLMFPFPKFKVWTVFIMACIYFLLQGLFKQTIIYKLSQKFQWHF